MNYIYIDIGSSCFLGSQGPAGHGHVGSCLEPSARTKQYMSDPEYKTTCFLYLPAIVSASVSGPPEGRGVIWCVYR